MPLTQENNKSIFNVRMKNRGSIAFFITLVLLRLSKETTGRQSTFLFLE